MASTHTFKEAKGKFVFTVKSEFLQECPNPEQFSSYELITEKKLLPNLHNPVGPAIHALVKDIKEYWLNGNKLSDEEGKDMEHKAQFNKELLEEIKS